MDVSNPASKSHQEVALQIIQQQAVRVFENVEIYTYTALALGI